MPQARKVINMIKLENTVTPSPEQWKATIRGTRNPMNSWGKSDSQFWPGHMRIGENDLDLMKRLIKAGTDHSKFMRFLPVMVDITAPLYWWKEFDTYKVGTVANSCSTMHKIQAQEFTLDDFSCEHLDIRTKALLEEIIKALNDYRELYIEYNPDDFEIKGCPSKKDIWWQMIQLLPSSYNQKRTVMLNYAVLRNIYHARAGHKLDEWQQFREWIETLPYSELITMDSVPKSNKDKIADLSEILKSDKLIREAFCGSVASALYEIPDGVDLSVQEIAERITNRVVGDENGSN
jgi:hypothetical protein